MRRVGGASRYLELLLENRETRRRETTRDRIELFYWRFGAPLMISQGSSDTTTIVILGFLLGLSSVQEVAGPHCQRYC